MTAIKKAIDLAGGQAALSKKINVHASFISQWVTGRRPIPAEHCRAIEAAVDGQVTRYDLRPDVFGTAEEQYAARRVSRQKQAA